MPESSGLVCELIEFELLTLTEDCEESSLNYQFKRWDHATHPEQDHERLYQRKNR